MCHKLFLRFVRWKKNEKPFHAQLNNDVLGRERGRDAEVSVAKSENKAISKINDGKIYVKQQKIDHTIRAGLKFHDVPLKQFWIKILAFVPLSSINIIYSI
jgi:hypothetical protein